MFYVIICTNTMTEAVAPLAKPTGRNLIGRSTIYTGFHFSGGGRLCTIRLNDEKEELRYLLSGMPH